MDENSAIIKIVKINNADKSLEAAMKEAVQFTESLDLSDKALQRLSEMTVEEITDELTKAAAGLLTVLAKIIPLYSKAIHDIAVSLYGSDKTTNS